MKEKFPIHFPLLIGGSITILAIGALALCMVLYPQNPIRVFAMELQNRIGMHKIASQSSTVEISETPGQLRLQFAIVDNDEASVKRFSERLGVSNEWEKGISLGLDNI